MTNDFNIAANLGKGEVVSSILPGSTSKSAEINGFYDTSKHVIATSEHATEREHDAWIGGKSVESVHGASPTIAALYVERNNMVFGDYPRVVKRTVGPGTAATGEGDILTDSDGRQWKIISEAEAFSFYRQGTANHLATLHSDGTIR